MFFVVSLGFYFLFLFCDCVYFLFLTGDDFPFSYLVVFFIY